MSGIGCVEYIKTHVTIRTRKLPVRTAFLPRSCSERPILKINCLPPLFKQEAKTQNRFCQGGRVTRRGRLLEIGLPFSNRSTINYPDGRWIGTKYSIANGHTEKFVFPTRKAQFTRTSKRGQPFLPRGISTFLSITPCEPT